MHSILFEHLVNMFLVLNFINLDLRPPEGTKISQLEFSQNQLPLPALFSPSFAVLVAHMGLDGNTKAHCLKKGNGLMMEFYRTLREPCIYNPYTTTPCCSFGLSISHWNIRSVV